MTDAEKKWDEWDVKFAQTILGDIQVPVDDTIRTGCKAAREAHKQALKKEIEKEMAEIQNFLAGLTSEWEEISNRARLNQCGRFLSKIDTVTPKQ